MQLPCLCSRISAQAEMSVLMRCDIQTGYTAGHFRLEIWQSPQNNSSFAEFESYFSPVNSAFIFAHSSINHARNVHRGLGHSTTSCPA